MQSLLGAVVSFIQSLIGYFAPAISPPSFYNRPATATLAPIPTPTPIRLKPDNGTKGTFAIGQAKNHAGPTISQVIFDPLDVKKGQKLTITVRANDTTPISAIVADLAEDTSRQTISFTRTDGTNTDGTWTGAATLENTVWYLYKLTVTATSKNGSATIIVAPRS